MNNWSTKAQRARESYAQLCRLYGDDEVAQRLMRVRGATNPEVARLARVLAGSDDSIRAIKVYTILVCLPPGYGRLRAACANDGAALKAVAFARWHRAWTVDRAIAVALALAP